MHTDLLSSNKLTEQVESLYVTCMHNSPKTDRNRDPDSSTSELHADVKSEVCIDFMMVLKVSFGPYMYKHIYSTYPKKFF